MYYSMLCITAGIVIFSISLSKLFSSVLQQNTRQLKTQVCLSLPATACSHTAS